TSLIIPVALSEQVIAHPSVCGVTLTGSYRAGSIVASQAGKYMKKSVMELGGSDPYIVLRDADLKQACKTGSTSRMMNAGQVCISAKRFIVEESIFDQFIEEQKNILENMILSDPLLEETTMGPMARADLLENIESQIDKSVKMGAKIICGGKRLNQNDLFFEPTVITNVTKEMPLYSEETFGPVSVVIKAKDAEEAVQIANDSGMGLGASIWTEDLVLAQKIAGHIEAGAVFINGMTKSDPRLPFGGIKESGYGRELGIHGLKEFVNIKTVWVK
ncbi:MAG: aldehyde dehydrogenase family protein, partial [Chlorobiales bacterium]|nr:aldehyde dehydrogenase family protein [Chlorobiales bacterium]